MATLVQSQRAAGNSGTSASATLPGASTAGNLLVMWVDAWNNAANVTFTPPAGWVQAGTTVQNNVYIAETAAMYYYPNCPAGITSVAVTMSAAASAWHIAVEEYSGVATASPLDGAAIRQQFGTLTPSSGSITTTAPGDLLIGFMGENDVNGVYTLTQPGGWTPFARQQDASAWASLYSAYQNQVSAGAAQYNPTLTSTQTDSIIGIMAFKAAGGGGTPQAIAGTGVASVTAALALTVSRQLASTLGADAAGSLATIVTKLLAGALTAQATAVLDLTTGNAASVSGSASAQASSILSLSVTKTLSGQASSAASGAFALNVVELSYREPTAGISLLSGVSVTVVLTTGPTATIQLLPVPEGTIK